MINTVMPLVTADPETIRLWVAESGVAVALVILIPIIAASIVIFVWGSGSQRLLTVAMLLGSAAIYTGSAWANSGPWFMYVEMGFDAISGLAVNIRYGVAAGMMLAATLPVAGAVVITRWPGRWSRVTVWLLSALTVVVLAYGSTMTVSSRGWVDPWSPAVREGIAACSADSTADSATLPVAPDRSIEVDCEDLLAHTDR